jgi:hypothetical protein
MMELERPGPRSRAALPDAWLVTARAVAWPAVGLRTFRLASLAVALASLSFYLANGATRTLPPVLHADALERLALLGMDPATYAAAIGTLEVGFVVVCAIIAGAIFLGKTRGWYGTFVALTLVMLAIALPYSVERLGGALPADPGGRALSIAGWTLFVLFLYLFPDGRFTPRWTAPLAVAWSCFQLLALLAAGTPLDPYGLPGLVPAAIGGGWLLTGVLAQAVHYTRIADPEQRQQTKWVVLGFAVAVGGSVAMRLATASNAGIPAEIELLAPALMLLTALAVPLTIVVSVRRYHLWDVDIIVDRALVYTIVAAILAGLTAASMEVTKGVFRVVTGASSDASILFTTILVVSLFTPLKERIDHHVKRLVRPSPDSTVALDAFGDQMEAVLQVIDPRLVARRVLTEAAAAFHADGAALYLRNGDSTEPFDTVGRWGGTAAIEVAVHGGETSSGMLRLGSRRNGATYSRRDVQSLERTADLLGRALELADAVRPAAVLVARPFGLRPMTSSCRRHAPVGLPIRGRTAGRRRGKPSGWATITTVPAGDTVRRGASAPSGR